MARMVSEDNVDGDDENEEETTALITYYAAEKTISAVFSFKSGDTRKLSTCGENCYVFYKVTEKNWNDDDDSESGDSDGR